MPEEAFLLSKNDRQLIQRLLDENRNKILNASIPAELPRAIQTPDVFVAMPVSSGGIPALTPGSPDQPGVADCEIWKINATSGTPELEETEVPDLPVYNITTSVVPQDWVLIHRTKPGKWVVGPISEAAAGTGTGDLLSWCLAQSDWDDNSDDPKVSCKACNRDGTGETGIAFDVYLPRKRAGDYPGSGASSAGLDPSVYSGDVISYQLDDADDKICQTPYLWSFIGQILEYGSAALQGKIPTGWSKLSPGAGRITLQLDSGGESNENALGDTGGFTWHGETENNHDPHEALTEHTIDNHGTHGLGTHGTHTIADHGTHGITNHGTHALDNHGTHTIADHGTHAITNHGAHTLNTHADHTVATHGTHTIADHGTHSITNHGTHALNTHDAHTIDNHDDHPQHDHHPVSAFQVWDIIAGESAQDVTDPGGVTVSTQSANGPNPHVHDIDMNVAETVDYYEPFSQATEIGEGTGTSGLLNHSAHTSTSGQGLGHDGHSGSALTDTYVHSGTFTTDAHAHSAGSGQGLSHDSHIGGSGIGLQHAVHFGTAITDTYIHAGSFTTDEHTHGSGSGVGLEHAVHGGTALTDTYAHSGTFTTDAHTHGSGSGVGLEHGAHTGDVLTDPYVHGSTSGQGLLHDASDEHNGPYNGDVDTDNRQKFVVVERIIRVK